MTKIEGSRDIAVLVRDTMIDDGTTFVRHRPHAEDVQGGW